MTSGSRTLIHHTCLPGVWKRQQQFTKAQGTRAGEAGATGQSIICASCTLVQWTRIVKVWLRKGAGTSYLPILPTPSKLMAYMQIDLCRQPEQAGCRPILLFLVNKRILRKTCLQAVSICYLIWILMSSNILAFCILNLPQKQVIL